MIVTWISVVLFIAVAVFTCLMIGLGDFRSSAKGRLIAATITLCVVGCGIALWRLYGTEPGKRAQKTFQSETDGGLERSVKIYDIKGDLLTEYNGKFDITYSDGVVKVKFDSDGKRHIVYCLTGTVVIDEE